MKELINRAGILPAKWGKMISVWISGMWECGIVVDQNVSLSLTNEPPSGVYRPPLHHFTLHCFQQNDVSKTYVINQDIMTVRQAEIIFVLILE